MPPPQRLSSTFSKSRYYFSDFRRWRHVLELLLASNLLAVILAVASVKDLSELSLITLLHYLLFVSWVAICFAVCVDKLQKFLTRFDRHIALMICFLLLIVLVLSSTCAVNILKFMGDRSQQYLDLSTIFAGGLHHVVLGGGVGLICLRYLYVREQWIEQQQSELMARVQALQARIHPHFLFNSLNTVVSLIAIDPFKAEQMLIDLSGLFRASLTELREVALQEEIDLCQRYLKIESVRLGDRLHVKWRIEGEDQLKFAKIPLLTLQPLLENCIYHGIESMSDQSTVSILIEVIDRQVSIVLTNPYQSGLQSTQGNGIAIDNVKQRLMAYYGATVSFKIFARDGIFTTLLSYKYQ
ncbi:MAG: histidine kinase [Acinetobacter populi]|jgi:two-component system sensor histidine kinase AlgZ|uniref:sensor histidine kinase n=1 Tax=Acinetobacter populi TaxID=1582270 RepID=UPI00235693CB|nr:histidine kinase [Acinetobacter populi]MCH4248136.1 histidine kinase [Acinetobacter populi]